MTLRFHLLLSLLLIVGCCGFSSQAQAAKKADFQFEGKLPQSFRASKGSILLADASRYKDGKQSLHWQWSAPSTLCIEEGAKIKNSVRSLENGIMCWIYNETPLNSALKFRLEDKDGNLIRWFNFGLHFKGWRACWIKYIDMHTEGATAREGEARIVIESPKGIAKGEVWLDRLTISSKKLHMQVTADEQIPDNNRHISRTPWHWTRLWEWEQYKPDMALEEPEQATIRMMERLALRLDQTLSDFIPSIKQVKLQLLPAATERFGKAGIQRTADGRMKGAPLLSNDECDRKAGELRNADIEEMLQGFAMGALFLKDRAAEERFFLTFDHAIEQGFAFGSSQGTNHHYGYSTRRMFRMMWLMRNRIAQRGKTAEYLKVLSYWSGLAETRRPYVYGRDELLDTWHTLLIPKLITALMEPNLAERYRNLKMLSRWISGSLDYTPGTIGGIKVDGTSFHHGGFYPAYSVGSFAALGHFCKITAGTEFQLDKESRLHLKHALRTLATYTAHRDWGIGISGRHPLAKNGRIPKHDINAFGYLAMQGDLTDKGYVFDPELAADYLRLGGTDKELTTLFTNSGIRPSVAPEGFYTYNYAAFGVHRRDNWMVSLKAYNSDVWCSEIYTHDNRYGRYQSYGTVQIFASGTPLNAHDSGYTQKGWDWNRVPGATTIHLPWEKLDSPNQFSMMIRSEQRFSGVGSLEGRNGVLAFHLQEADKTNFTKGASALKSVFAFDNLLVYLGSGITNSNHDYPTETTIFQNRLDNLNQPLRLGKETYEAFPLEKSLTAKAGKGGKVKLTDPQGVFYIVKDGTVTLTKQNQTSPDDKHCRPQSGNFASAVISHGTAPRDAHYEYMALIQPSKKQMKEVSKEDPYHVLRCDNKVHALRHKATGSEAFVCFEEFDGALSPKVTMTSVLQHADKECIVMFRPKAVGEMVLSITTPDLGLTEKTYTTKQASQILEREITLKGCWTLDETSEKVSKKVKISHEGKKTHLLVKCQHGQPVEMQLKRL